MKDASSSMRAIPDQIWVEPKVEIPAVVKSSLTQKTNTSGLVVPGTHPIVEPDRRI